MVGDDNKKIFDIKSVEAMGPKEMEDGGAIYKTIVTNGS